MAHPYHHLKNNASPLKCWEGYKRKPGTSEFSKGSCVKASPVKKKQKGGGTTKTCLPKAKIASLSADKKKELVSACLLYTSPSPRDS